MSRKISANTKAQFFIASAIIIIVTATLIFHYVTKLEKVSSIDLEARDISPFFGDVAEGYEKIVENSLADASNDPNLDPPTVIDNNLNSYTQIIQDLATKDNIAFDAQYNIRIATNRTMNATVNITMVAQRVRLYKSLDILREINVTIAEILQNSPCVFRFYGYKEYGEPLFYEPTSNFVIYVNDAPIICTLVYLGTRTYEVNTCSGECRDGSILIINNTDIRHVRGVSKVQSCPWPCIPLGLGPG